jgi:hypothetical protein
VGRIVQELRLGQRSATGSGQDSRHQAGDKRDQHVCIEGLVDACSTPSCRKLSRSIGNAADITTIGRRAVAGAARHARTSAVPSITGNLPFYR